MSAPDFAAGGAGEDLEHVGAIVLRSTRHLITDARFATILEEDFGIASSEILAALEGEPRRRAIEICAWAEKTREPARALNNWARKHRKAPTAHAAIGADCGVGGFAAATSTRSPRTT